MINVALLSRWHVHADDYAKDVLSNDNLNIACVWDEDKERGQQWAKELNVPFIEDLETVLSDTTIDAVVVTTPTNDHKEVIMAAAKSGKHIFTEKILAFTLKDSEEIYEAVEAAGVKLMVSLPRLTDNSFLDAEEAIKKGWLGQLTTIRCRLAHNGIVKTKQHENGWLPKHFLNKAETGGGAMIDLGAHPIYLLNRLAGKAQAVYSLFKSNGESEVDDNSVLLLDYDNNTIGIIETSFVSNGSPFQLELYGTEGSLLISDDEVLLNSTHVNAGEPTVLGDRSLSYPAPMVQWVSAIQTGVTPTISKEDIINLTIINQAAIMSHEEKRRVKLDEII